MNKQFEKWALTKFSGCDNSHIEAGTPKNPSIWLLGIEHGTYKSIHDGKSANTSDNNYSVEQQMKWPYNQKAFKLLASMFPEYSLENYKYFAKNYQPFVKGSKGFFKGNLYPYPCHSQHAWGNHAHAETGFPTKKDYLDWCEKERFPFIRTWIIEHKPKIVIGVGISQRDAFSKAVFGKSLELEEVRILEDKKQRLFFKKNAGINLVVIPHFSGRWGLNSNALIEKSGQMIANFL